MHPPRFFLYLHAFLYLPFLHCFFDLPEQSTAWHDFCFHSQEAWLFLHAFLSEIAEQPSEQVFEFLFHEHEPCFLHRFLLKTAHGSVDVGVSLGHAQPAQSQPQKGVSSSAHVSPSASAQ